MPIHPHECRCGHAYEVITLSVTAEPDPACPKCGRTGERRFGVPSVKTDAFRPGTALDGGQFGSEEQRRAYAGSQDTAGKRYMHSLAAYHGDPRAWVSDMADARRVIEERGWGCESLGIKPRDGVPPPTAPLVADDIVAEVLERKVRDGELPQPGKLTKQQRQRAIEETREQLSAPADLRKAWDGAKPTKKKAKVKKARAA